MKTKLLTACVAAALLAGCGSDGKDPQQQVQAYDGAIKGIQGQYSCTVDGVTQTGVLPATAHSGFSTVSAPVDAFVITNPESCVFTFNPTPGAFDVSNGKLMDEVGLTIPRGLAASGKQIIATPLTTIIAQTLPEGAVFDTSTASEVLNALGLGDILGAGISVDRLLTDLDGVIKELQNGEDEATKKLAGTLVATTHVLTDVLVKKGSLTATETATLAKNIASQVTSTNPYYPKTGDDVENLGDPIFVDVKTTVTTVLSDDTQKAALTNPDADEAEVNKALDEIKDTIKEEEAVEVPDGGTPPSGSGSGSGGDGGNAGGLEG